MQADNRSGYKEKDLSFPQFEQYNESSLGTSQDISDVYSTSITMDDIKDIKGPFQYSEIDPIIDESLNTSQVSENDTQEMINLANEICYVTDSSLFKSCSSNLSLVLASMTSEQISALKQVLTPKFVFNNSNGQIKDQKFTFQETELIQRYLEQSMQSINPLNEQSKGQITNNSTLCINFEANETNKIVQKAVHQKAFKNPFRNSQQKCAIIDASSQIDSKSSSLAVVSAMDNVDKIIEDTLQFKLRPQQITILDQPDRKKKVSPNVSPIRQNQRFDQLKSWMKNIEESQTVSDSNSIVSRTTSKTSEVQVHESHDSIIDIKLYHTLSDKDSQSSTSDFKVYEVQSQQSQKSSLNSTLKNPLASIKNPFQTFNKAKNHLIDKSNVIEANEKKRIAIHSIPNIRTSSNKENNKSASRKREISIKIDDAESDNNVSPNLTPNRKRRTRAERNQERDISQDRVLNPQSNIQVLEQGFALLKQLDEIDKNNQQQQRRSVSPYRTLQQILPQPVKIDKINSNKGGSALISRNTMLERMYQSDKHISDKEGKNSNSNKSKEFWKEIGNIQ